MKEKILALKKLNAAYIAALEYDHCPDVEEAQSVSELFETGIQLYQLEEALTDNQGRRPDEIAREMSDLIKELDNQ